MTAKDYITIIISAVGLAITIYTVLKSNAQTQQKLASRFDVIDVEIKHIKQDQRELSDRVEKHNGVMERTFRLEAEVKNNAENIVDAKADIREIKNKLMED